jgi:hypothetical protein
MDLDDILDTALTKRHKAKRKTVAGNAAAIAVALYTKEERRTSTKG